MLLGRLYWKNNFYFVVEIEDGYIMFSDICFSAIFDREARELFKSSYIF